MNTRSTGRMCHPLAFSVLATALLFGIFAGESHAQYRSFNEAYFAGIGSLKARQYENARAPLEYALQAAGDDRSRLVAHAALTEVYFHAGQTDKVINSLDFILTHSNSEPERNLVRGAMVRYVKNQGKTDEVVKLYEGRLRTNPEDIPALYVLSDIYSQVQQNPKRAADLVTKLGAILKKNGGDNGVFADPNLAGQYVKAGKFKDGAAMYEQLAANEPNMSGVYYKDAAQAWLKGGDKAKALAAAKNADNSAPENRGDLLEYFYHRALGEVYLATNEPALAVEHFETAIATTKIEGYAKDTRKLLAQAQILAARRGGAKPSAATKSTTTASTKGGLIDLNKATLAQLQTVDGITEAIAVQIIDHRKSTPFTSVSELIELDGVDKASLAKIRGKVTVGAGK